MLSLIAFIICFVVGIYYMILLVKSVKENKNPILDLFLAIFQFILAGLNLYILITK